MVKLENILWSLVLAYTLIASVLKLTNYIDWSWWAIFTPLIIMTVVTLILVIAVVGLIIAIIAAAIVVDK